MEVYIIEEHYQDVFCEKTHLCIEGNNVTCGQKIHCVKRIHKVTSDKEYAIKFTRNKPNWGYQTYDLD